MFSGSVALRTSDGHSIFDAETQQSINAPADVYVGHHVWLGSGVRISKGTSVGSGTVVGQMSIATRQLDGNSVYAGAPARKVRDGIVWSRTHSWDDIPDDYLIR